MSEFTKFKKEVINKFESIKDYNLFTTNVSKDELWNFYLDSFPEGTNKVYRERREYDCQCCKQFIRQVGNLVYIKDNKMYSIWDFDNLEYPFNVVSNSLAEKVKQYAINNIFLIDNNKIGNDSTKTIKSDGSIEKWEHFYLEVINEFVCKKDLIDTKKGNSRTNKEVFKRSMEELTLYSAETIIDLIDQGSLYRGDEHRKSIETFIKYKKDYEKLNESEKDNWLWNNSFNNPIVRIRNTAIGTLLIDISNEVDLDESVTKFESVMAPTNYKRPKALITKKMVKDAENKIEVLGLTESLGRRMATLDDITVNNVLFVNRESKKQINGSIFNELNNDIPDNKNKLSKVHEIKIDEFINKILPKSSSIELLFENKHQNNLVTLVAPENINSPRILQWDNNFSWSYNGNVTDSIKQNVAKAGGDVSGVLRFSIQWNENGKNNNDFDAHCIDPNKEHIFYGNKRSNNTGGVLDVDIVSPIRDINNNVAVENITWDRLTEGNYKFFVNNYSHRGGTSGFKAQIEFNGTIYDFEYDKELRNSENVVVAEILIKGNEIKFIKSIENTITSKETWGIKTNQFINVSVCMFSPNYWDEQCGKGNKHYLFFLEGCKTESTPRGIYNEFLRSELTQHRRVFEALGSKMKVKESDNQLSGLGFSTTKRNSVIARVKGNFERVLKINF